MGEYPTWQKFAQTAPTLWPPPARRGRPTMTNKQTATLSLQLLSVMDKLFTLAAPMSGPLLFFTGHPNHGQRVFVASQVAIQAQAECVTISAHLSSLGYCLRRASAEQ